MPLQPTTKPVGLFGSLDLKTDAKYVEPGRSLTAQNVRFPAVTRTEKRYGQSVLSNSIPASSSMLSTGQALGAYGDELLAFDGSALYAYGAGAGYWVSRGALTETQLTVKSISAGINSAVDVASATNGTLEVYAWADSNGSVYYSARDTTSGTFFAQNALLSTTATAPQVIFAGIYVYIFAMVGAVFTVFQFLPSSMGTGPIQQQNLGGALLGTYPAATATTDGNVFVAYVSAADTLTLAAYSTVLALVGAQNLSVVGLTAGAKASVASGLISSTYYAAAVTQPSVSATATLAFVNKSMAVAASSVAMVQPTGIAAGYTCSDVSIQISGSDWTAAAGLTNTSNYQPCVYFAQGYSTVAGVDNVSAPRYGLNLGSQLAVYGGDFYWLGVSRAINVLLTASQQPTYFLLRAPHNSHSGAVTLDVTAPVLLTRYLNGQAAANVGNQPAISAPTSSSLFIGSAYRAQLRADSGGTLFTSNYVTSTTISFPESSSLQVVSFNGGALINCGLTYNYDGTQLVESGFWEFPDGINTSTDSPGTTNQYQYFVTYEWTDALGNLTISAPSYAVVINTTAAIGAGATNILAVPYTALTLKSNVVIGIYRTTANSSSPAYKVGTVTNLTTGVGAVNFTDTTTDLVAAGGQRLYAPADLSGEIENDPPPPFKYMFATKTRVFGIPQDNPYQIWFSKPVNYGRPAEFSAAQAISIETEGGLVTGLSALDTQAVVFKAERIYYLPGDGPNAAGRPYNAFPQSLQLIASTTGCTTNQSVLVTADGLYFKSPTGLTQLTRGVQVNPAFGLPVQPLVQALTITGAKAVPSQNQLRWTSAEGTCVVYDYVTQRWSTYTNYDCVGYQPFNGTFARLRTDGRIWYEDTSTYLDNLIGVPMVVETAWLKPAELAQGWAAVWYATVLGEYLSAHNLVVEVYFDYLDSPADVLTFDATTNGNFGSYGSGSPYGSDPYYGASSSVPIYGTAYQVRAAMKRQVCEAVKFKIYDTSITGASCALNEIALQLGVIGGLKRVPSAQQV